MQALGLFFRTQKDSKRLASFREDKQTIQDHHRMIWPGFEVPEREPKQNPFSRGRRDMDQKAWFRERTMTTSVLMATAAFSMHCKYRGPKDRAKGCEGFAKLLSMLASTMGGFELELDRFGDDQQLDLVVDFEGRVSGQDFGQRSFITSISQIFGRLIARLLRSRGSRARAAWNKCHWRNCFVSPGSTAHTRNSRFLVVSCIQLDVGDRRVPRLSVLEGAARRRAFDRGATNKKPEEAENSCGHCSGGASGPEALGGDRRLSPFIFKYAAVLSVSCARASLPESKEKLVSKAVTAVGRSLNLKGPQIYAPAMAGA